MINTKLFTIRNFIVIGLIALIWQVLSKPVRNIVSNDK